MSYRWYPLASRINKTVRKNRKRPLTRPVDIVSGYRCVSMHYKKMQYSTYHISGPRIIQIAIEGVFHTYKPISLRSYRCPGSNIQSWTCQFYSVPASLTVWLGVNLVLFYVPVSQSSTISRCKSLQSWNLWSSLALIFFRVENGEIRPM